MSSPTRGRRRIVLTSAALAGLTGGTVLLVVGHGAGAVDTPATTTSLLTEAPVHVDVASSPLARDIAALLPGVRVADVWSLDDGVRRYTEIDARDQGRNGLLITVYQTFARSELDDAGFQRRAVSGGTLWTGGLNSSMRFVYYLGDSGVGLRVGSESSTGEAASVDDLTNLAIRISRLDSVILEARP